MNEVKEKEQDQEQGNNKVYEGYEYVQSFFAKWMALILTIAVSIGIFVISSMSGGKEVQAPNSVGSKIMQQWRLENPGQDFPEEFIGTYNFTTRGMFGEETHEYYFVIESYVLDENGIETSVVKEWYWAYDGGIGYVFSDWRFYFFTALVFALSSFIVVVNYSSSKSKARTAKSFKSVEYQYALVKNEIKEDVNLLDDFCVYQNKQAYDDKKRDIVEGADILYTEYLEKSFDTKNIGKFQKNGSGLANWQKRKLREIRKIKIDRLKKNDLLQESATQGKTKIKMLPTGESTHDKRYFLFNMIQRFFTIGASGLVIAFSIEFLDYNLGITYALTIIISAVSATIAGADFVLTKLRSRMIAKRDWLLEFKTMIPMLKEQKKQRELAFKKAYEEQQAKNVKEELDKKNAKEDLMKQKEILRLPEKKTVIAL